MNALRLISGFAVVFGCHASLLPASTLPLTHAVHLPGLTSYASNSLNHLAHVPAATPYAQAYQYAAAAAAPVLHTNSYVPQVAYNHAIAPAVETTQHHSQDELGQYEFGYAGGPSSRHESGDAYGKVRGSYSYVDAYGKVQKQSYVADEHGFRVVGTNLPSTAHHHLGKRSIASYPASTGPLVGHHAVAPVARVAHAAHHVAPVVHSGHHVAHAAHHVAPVVHSGHHVAHSVPVAHHAVPVAHHAAPVAHHAVPVAHHGHSHQATYYTAPGAHVSHVDTRLSHGYGHNHGGFSYAFSAASPVYGYARHY